MRLKQSAWEKAKKVTFYFEGRGYTQITGNFDGMGLSLGALQWNFGTGTLQPLFSRLFAEHPNIAKELLPEGGKWLKDAIENGWVIQWCKQIQENNKVLEPWYSSLVNLCYTKEFQSIQDDAMEWYKNKAIMMCDGFGIMTDRAFALMFDIAVQNGGLNPYPLAEPTDTAKLEAVANVAVTRSLAQWQGDVGKRKLAIVYGQDMGRGWCGVEFDDQSAFEEENQPAPQEQEVITLTWEEIILKVSSNPDEWKNAINVAVNAAKADGDLGALEIFQHLPTLIEKIYNSKG